MPQSLRAPVSSEASSGASKNDSENSNSRSSGEMVEVDKVFFEALLNSFKRQKQIREATEAAHATLKETKDNKKSRGPYKKNIKKKEGRGREGSCSSC